MYSSYMYHANDISRIHVYWVVTLSSISKETIVLKVHSFEISGIKTTTVQHNNPEDQNPHSKTTVETSVT